jgi:hypothetical protein
MDLDGAYEWRLDMMQAAVDLSELIGGPVLHSHNRFDVNAVLCVVESAQGDGVRGTATIRFSERAMAVMNDVRQGVLGPQGPRTRRPQAQSAAGAQESRPGLRPAGCATLPESQREFHRDGANAPSPSPHANGNVMDLGSA